ncbi:MAG: helix-turn-helix domain-containing protein [Muribaculaceae bacterium]|nr:helix-turn-helix domain-containing protein [Muribaculaceae bacterium]
MKRLLAVLLIIIHAAAAAFATEYLCRKVSLDQGLSHSNVTCLARDGRGFVWIGTRFGLNRYDFDGVVNYYHDRDNESTITDNSVRALYTDAYGGLWVAGENGLAHYDEQTNSFERITADGKQVNVRSFHEEGNGMLLGGAGRIFYHDFASGTTALLQVKGGSKFYYTDIHRRGTDFYVLATRWDGMWLFDRTHATVTRMPGIADKHIMASTIDAGGVLYVSPYGEGLQAYDRAGTCLFSLNTSNSALPSNIILDIIEHDKRIWIATDGGGISIYDPATGSFEDMPPRSALGSLGAVTSLYTDRHHNLYAGTVRDGAVTVLPVAIHTFQSGRKAPFAAISSMWLDESDGKVWVGDDGNGVLIYRPGSGVLEAVPSTAGMKVTDIEGYDPQHLLVVTFDKGFFLLNKQSGALSPASGDLTQLWADNPNRAVPMHARTLSHNLIAIVGNNISTYNPQSGTVVTPAKAIETDVPEGALVPFYSQVGRLLCFGSDFVSEFDPVTAKHTVLFRLPRAPRIHSAAYDGRHRIFVATDKGVTCIDTSTGEMTQLPDINERVSAMVCEGDKRLWIATTRTLYLRNLDNGNLAAFGINDGVTPNEYQAGATLSADGRVLLGGIYGLMRVNSAEVDAILASHIDPELSIAELEIDGVSAYSQIHDGVIKVPDHFTGISLSVIDNGSNSQRRQRFRYTVSGKGSEKNLETSSRSLDLSFIDPGADYDVNLSCMRPDGTWTQPHHLVTLAVMAPWYRSPWMWGIVAVLTIALLIYWEMKRIQRRKARLASQLETYRHNTLEREVAFLVNTNYALRTPLTLIYAPLKLTLEKLRAGEHTDLLPELERVYSNTKKMRDTIDMALELHNVTAAASADKELTTHDITRSIDDSIANLRSDIDLKHLNCVYIPSQDMFPAVYDRGRLGSVIEILLRNAIRRSPDHATVEVRTVMRDNFIRVSVSDAGENLDPDTLRELFSKYFHDENAKFTDSLAFAYAKSIVELQGGSIGAYNNDDLPGVTVWFEIPAAGAPAAEAYTRRRHSEATNPPAEIEPLVADIDTSAMTAIVVEEDNDLCMFVAMQLSEFFGKVLHAFNGKDALLLIRQYQPDIVISSLRLPFMSGLELCHAVKKSPETSHIPVILLTALKEGSTLENAYEAGADSYLAKPFDLAVLMARCRNLLHTRSVIRRRYASPESAPETPRKARTNADETFMFKINKIISENISNPDFGVDTIVEKMASSRSALYSKFKDISGQTIGAYIADCRFRKAKELLTDGSHTMAEISDMLGFSSQRYFSTFFKERAGVSPSAFRASAAAKN